MGGRKIKFKVIISILVIFLAVISASAGEWRGKGTPLYTIASGKIRGSLYVHGGHGYTMENPYIEYFDVPRGKVIFARLYVPVWNYNKGDTLSVAINNEGPGERTQPDYIAAWGVASYAYNVTQNISSGHNKVSVSYYNPNGAPYGVILVAAVENLSLPETQFWITEGNDALSYVTKRDRCSIQFNGSRDLTEVQNASLFTVIIAGTAGEEDRLYFNSHLLGADIGRSKSGAYIDIDRFNVTPYLASSDNVAVFERGEEAYLHPFNAILAVEYVENKEVSHDRIEIYQKRTAEKSSIPLPVILVLAITFAVLGLRFFMRKSR